MRAFQRTTAATSLNNHHELKQTTHLSMNEHMHLQLEGIQDRNYCPSEIWRLFCSLFTRIKLLDTDRSTFTRSIRFHEDPHEILAFVFVASFFFLAFLDMTTSSILSAGIITDSLALSDSADCGIWQGLGIEWKTVRAADQYRKDCYVSRSSPPPSCQPLATDKIPYKTASNTSCPFDDSGACVQGPMISFTLETGMIDSAILGIIAPLDQRCFFQRTMTCAPILQDNRHIYLRYINLKEYWIYEYGPRLINDPRLNSYNLTSLNYWTELLPVEKTAGNFLNGTYWTE